MWGLDLTNTIGENKAKIKATTPSNTADWRLGVK
jgi:hypothetical protein